MAAREVRFVYYSFETTAIATKERWRLLAYTIEGERWGWHKERTIFIDRDGSGSHGTRFDYPFIPESAELEVIDEGTFSALWRAAELYKKES